MIYAMSYAIIVCNVLALCGLLATAFLGYALGNEVAAGENAVREAVAAAFTRHFQLALVTTIFSIFGQTMTFFYFIGTGKSIKTAVALHGLDPAHVETTKLFKRQTSPPAMWALLFVMAAFILGGGVPTGAIPAWLHHTLAWGAIITHGWATAVGAGVIRTNMNLLASLDAEVRQLERDGSASRQNVVV